MKRHLLISALPVCASFALATPTGQLPTGRWALKSVVVRAQTLPAETHSRPTLTFKGTRVSGFTGCDTFQGTFVPQNDRLQFSPVAIPKKACRSAAQTVQQRNYLNLLNGTNTYELTRGSLVLHSGIRDQLVFTRIR